MSRTRLEADSIGVMEVPADAYYGVQALRASRNFPFTGTKLHPIFIKNLAQIKKAAAITNAEAGVLEKNVSDAIVSACNEVISGKLREEFIVDAIQGGAGTSANMNMNEVLANRSGEFLGDTKGSYLKVHPNDHVNMAQSTNDVIPTAGKLTVLDLLRPLVSELSRLEATLSDKALEFDDVITMGRTQLQDAVPVRLGQIFHGYASMVARDRKRIEKSFREMYSVNLGGTAVGTAVNVSDFYFSHIVPVLEKLTGYPLKQADDLFDATENLDGFVTVSGTLKTCAIDLSKMCNDLRLLSSGPKTGFGEINLPAKQNGSSIMPGKVNPVIPEVVSQVAFHIAGHDTTITMAAEAGQLELNAFEPVVFCNLFDSISTLEKAVTTLIDNCISGITANREHCRELMESSAGIATALCPYIGYKSAAVIAKTAVKTGKSVRSLVLEQRLLTENELEQILDPYLMTGLSTSNKNTIKKAI